MIFTEKQKKLIRKRLAGDKTDKTGAFSKSIRPKLIVIREWIEKKDIIDKLLS